MSMQKLLGLENDIGKVTITGDLHVTGDVTANILTTSNINSLATLSTNAIRGTFHLQDNDVDYIYICVTSDSGAGDAIWKKISLSAL